MKITIEYTNVNGDLVKEEHEEALEFLLVVRKWVTATDGKNLIKYPETSNHTVCPKGGSMREIIKEVRQWLVENDNSSSND